MTDSRLRVTMRELASEWSFDDADQAHCVLDALDEYEQRSHKAAARKAKKRKR